MHNGMYEFVCDELRDLDEKAKRGEAKMGDVEYADMLEHYKKSVLTNQAMEGEGYSGRDYSRRYYDGRSYDDGESMARGRMNAQRDAMGRYSGRGYSRASSFADAIRDAMPMAPDEQTRMEMQRMAERAERI